MYQVHIDFNAASKAWRQNKKKVDECGFKYICGHKTRKGLPCNNSPLNGKIHCHIHKNVK